MIGNGSVSKRADRAHRRHAGPRAAGQEGHSGREECDRTGARRRLTEEPLAYLFATTAARMGQSAALTHENGEGCPSTDSTGRRSRVPDSPENRAAFGGSYAGALRGESGYPQVRAVAVMALRSHVMSAFRFADYATGETTLARDVWSEVPEDSLVIVDRNFPGRARAHSPREQRQSPLAVAGEDANALLGRRKARHRRRTGRRRSRPARSPPAVG